MLALVHAKWMAVDPFGEEPWLIHGSSNWSLSALVDHNSKVENIAFLPHREFARILQAHFKRVTGAFRQRDDAWIGDGGRIWFTDTHAYAIERSTDLAGAWSVSGTVSNRIGTVALTNGPSAVECIRVRRAH